ncbi:CAP domain-containing protein [Deinococcus sedimenti]|uniref:SCP domain-containing protein n=1 Tax=Deinococcus sedimenti TaxID=1867090 RepID=A0ABQ2S1W9_9DEIO|nr:CAP domain-containing protein [Deinococcus sedimenti]GGR78163.1 hypothetical protein GCM10008960_01160 [Deinococcus sedimenti]
MMGFRRALWAILGGAALFALGLSGIWLAGWWPGQRTAVPPAPRVEEPLAQPPAPSTPDAQPPLAPTPEVQVPADPAVPEPPVSPAPATAPEAERPVPSDLAGVQQEMQDRTPTSPASGEQQPVGPGRPTPTPPRPVVTTAPPAAAAPVSPLLAGLNRVRARAGMPAVKAEAAWQGGCAGHARYLVREDRAEHRQDPASPFRSAAGEACAPGHYFVSSRADATPERALRYWVGGAFHLPQLLDPRLTRVAAGVAHDEGGGFRSAVVLDVRRGLTGAARYPVRYPAPGQAAPTLTAVTGEWPDALAGCPPRPVRGAPIALLLGPARPQDVTAASLSVNGRRAGACLLTASTFNGANDSETRVGRGVLAAQGGALVLPDAPLPAGADVEVRFVTARGPVSWSFRTQP